MMNPDIAAIIGMRPVSSPTPSTPTQPPASAPSKERTKNVAVKASHVYGTEFEKIAQGAIKVVWVKRDKISPTGGDPFKSVYYTPVDAWNKNNEQELRSEAQKMKAIQANLPKEHAAGRYLAIEHEEVTPFHRIKGEYTLRVPKAEGDYEKEINKTEIPESERMKFGRHLLEGLSDLHKARYVHGDMKPENCLIYKENGEAILKISDFGKAKQVKPGGEPQRYSGNTRFVPPEGQLSEKSDVYGAAMMLIRNFEEPLGDRGEGLPIDPKDRDLEADSDLRGVEKFVVEHKAFLAYPRKAKKTYTGGNRLLKWIDSKISAWDHFKLQCKRRLGMLFRSSAEKQAQTKAMHDYINALQPKLAMRLGSGRANDLCQLLKEMTATDPNKRPTAKEAAEKYQAIFQHP